MSGTCPVTDWNANLPKPKGKHIAEPGGDRLKPWELLSSSEVFAAHPWVRLSVDQVLLPDGKIIDDYYQVQLADYAVIFAETVEGTVIGLRLYKHGAKKVTLALPAGSVENGEPPLEAAKRELLEETGYSSDNWSSLGEYVVNGNYGCGQAYIFLARGARQVAEPDSGDLEEMEIVFLQPTELLEAVRLGDVVGLGAVAAIALAMNPAFAASSAE